MAEGPSWLGIGALAAGALVGALAWSRRGPASLSGRVTKGPATVVPQATPRSSLPGAPGLHPLDPRALESTCLRLASTLVDQPYSYGGGTPSSPLPGGSPGLHGGRGWDCSGLSLAFSACLLRYSWRGPDLTARGLADLCTPVATGRQQPGDLAVYRANHVTAVLTPPQAALGHHSRVLSASGGGPSTNGDDVRARVRVFDRADYRSDFLTYMRLPPVEVSTEQAVACMALHTLLAGGVPAEDPRLPLAQLRAVLTRQFGAVPAVAAWLGRPSV